jgi:2-keto-4-pentenoate hydratase/2-oxohepta-3-ene-1,7-dioic acid hydratase in catechol pathway
VVARVNGEERQRGRTSDFVFSPAALISFISRSITLLPGDVVLTGTPSGVGPLAVGDRVEVEVEGIGILANTAAQVG